MRSNNKRHLILEAAFAVVAEQGANRLTLDAVAAESGFSKGGVLYHFNTKNALLSGMLDYLIKANLDRVQMQNDRAELAGLIEARQGTSKSEQRASLALLTAFAEDTRLLDPVRHQFRSLYKQSVESVTNIDEAALLFFANEGIRFLELLDVSPISSRAITRLNQHLIARAEKLK